MGGKAKKSVAQAEKRQNSLIRQLQKQERWMQWLLIAALVLILLLILLFGYATDWTRGLRKDNVTGGTPLSSNLDTLRQAGGTAGQVGGTNGSDGSGGTDGTNGSGGGTSTSEHSSTSTTTNNSTTNNGGTTNPSKTLPESLAELYNSIGAGDNINDVLDRAQELGLQTNCDDGLIIVTCQITKDGQTVTVKSLRVGDTVTSVVTN